MGAKFPIQAIITAVDKISGPVRRIAGTIKGRLNRVLGKTKALAGKATRAFGRMAMGVGKLGLAIGAAGIAASIKQFGDFSLNIARIGTLLPEARNAMADFGQQVKKDAITFGQSTAEVADAIFQGISAGVDPSTESIRKFNRIVGEASAGGFTDMATVVDGLTGVMNTYGLGVDKARSISDAFFVTNRLGKTTVEELASEFGKVGAIAQTVGVGYEEILSATVALTKGNIKTDRAMTALTSTLSAVIKGGKEAEEQAAALGIDFTVAGLKAKGFSGFLEELAQKTAGNAEAQSALFGNVKAFTAIAKLSSATGIKDFNDAMTAMGKRSGATGVAFKRVSGTVGFKIKQMKSTIGAFLAATGGGIFAGLGFDAGQDATTMLQRVTKLGEDLGKRIGGALANVSLEGIIDGFGRLVTSLGKIAKALGFIADLLPTVEGYDPVQRAREVAQSRGAADRLGEGFRTGFAQPAARPAPAPGGPLGLGASIAGSAVGAFTGKITLDIPNAPAGTKVQKVESSTPKIGIGAKVGRRVIGVGAAI